jgi:hypothetical protein
MRFNVIKKVPAFYAYGIKHTDTRLPNIPNTTLDLVVHYQRLYNSLVSAHTTIVK